MKTLQYEEYQLTTLSTDISLGIKQKRVVCLLSEEEKVLKKYSSHLNIDV